MTQTPPEEQPQTPPPAPSKCQIKFWGVRGSVPTPGAATVRYGGNTSCVEVRADGQIIVLRSTVFPGVTRMVERLIERLGKSVDVAFCLNHLLLKCLWTPSATSGFLACFDALVRAYVAGVTWEPPADLEARAARLLPGLFLARVDGKSPVEYVTEAADKDRVRRTSRALLRDPPDRLAAVRQAWSKELGL